MNEKLTKKHAVSALKKVTDPELGLDIYTLELIYDINLKDDDSIVIKMTLTSPGCPFASIFEEEIEKELRKIKEVKNVKIELVFDPAWSPDKIKEEVKEELGIRF